jgi:hypothetical protein
MGGALSLGLIVKSGHQEVLLCQREQTAGRSAPTKV